MKDVTILLQNQMPVVDSNTTVATLLSYLEENNFSHFPVTEEEIWIGNIQREVLTDFTESKETRLKELRADFQYFFTENTTHWSLVWDRFLYNHCNIMPVLDNDRKLLGLYRKEDFLELWNEIPSFSEKGTTVIIQKSSTAYSFSQISQIIESNNAKLLSLFILSLEEEECVILLKTNGVKNTEIIQDLRRYDYEIISKHVEDRFQEKLSDHSEYLQKYLSI